MKKIKDWYRLSICLLLSLSITSCEDFLDENPRDRVAQNNYYKTEQDAIAAVNSVYAYLGSYSTGSTAGVYHSTFWVTAGLASDNMLNNQLGALQNDQLASFTHNAENSNMHEIWRMHYKTITLANIAIDRIPGIAMDEALKGRLVSEAKFIRGLLYFNLVRMFGQVPLLVSEEAPLNPEVAGKDEIYAQIIRDLTDAESLPVDGAIQEGRATQGAAKAILAKVYLTLGDHANASAKARQVIESGRYELWEDFADVFKLSSRGGKEAIFSIGFGDGDGAISFWEVGQFNVRLLPAELSTARAQVSNTQGWQYATQDLYHAFTPEDERRAVTFMTEIEDDNGNTIPLDKVYIQKYWDREAEPAGNDSENDFPVIRYADVLLIQAEAQAELGNFGEANTYLNMVRRRANLPDVTLNNTQDFRQAILSERRKEFVAEGQRWFDLVRTGQLEEKVMAAKGVSVSPMYYLFPIPQRERQVNTNLPQNTGY